jgi:anti-sigma regulatory factor (Ser/Thr protein kinase)
MIGSRGRSLAVTIDDPTKVGEARRGASALAARLDFDETSQGKVALVVSEAASNLVKHAEGGELVVQARGWDESQSWLEILALDGGLGMRDVGQCQADGYSTAGSLGTGLGSIARLSDASGIYSHPGGGTAVWARLHANPESRAVANGRLELGAVNLPAPGEDACGDDWTLIYRDGQSFLLVVDGLGHGPAAAEAAEAAVSIVRVHPAGEPAELIEAAHAALRSTRGAALAIARIDPARGQVRYAGVGNISGVLADGRSGRTISMVSYTGIVGHAIRKIRSFDYPWSEDTFMIMHSDGLATRWDLASYPGISRSEPALLAGILYRDHRRGRDDVTVVVAREWSAPP